MQFEYAYKGSSSVQGGADSTAMSFSPDTKREPTFFRGDLRGGVPFREAMSALHQVVTGDLRFRPKDKTAYLEWRAKQDAESAHEVAAELARRDAKLAEQTKRLRADLAGLDAKLRELERARSARWQEYWAARTKFFQWLYQVNRDAWFVFDPVVTVHPDEVFFECFSQDESSYGRVGCSFEVFKGISERAYGTTNVDYSEGLYQEFQKIRSYKTTTLEVDPSGFEVRTTDQEAFKEVKIDLPDTWVRGFLQVSSAMTLPAHVLELHPMDVHNLCLVLRRRKEKAGPRSLRFLLQPGKPVHIRFDPWGLVVACPRSTYRGAEEAEVRIWGRRRLLVLERLIPVARKFTVHLLGKGLPSFWVADLGDLSFTLGLSGWTANDWSTAGNFDLMAPRADVDAPTKQTVFEGLKAGWLAAPDALAQRLGLDRAVVLGALSSWAQAGRAMFDLNKGVWRARELSREPLPMEKLRFQNEREEGATRFLTSGAVSVAPVTVTGPRVELAGQVKDKARVYAPKLTLDADERLVAAECGCNWHQQNKLFKGPCEHILALRMAQARLRDTTSR